MEHQLYRVLALNDFGAESCLPRLASERPWTTTLVKL